MIIATILKFSKFSTQYDRILVYKYVHCTYLSKNIIAMGINIFMLDPMAVSISWWSRPLKVVVYVVFIFLTTSTTALWWCASWWGFFSSQGGRGDPFSEKSQKKLVKSICTSFHTYISMGRKSKKSPGQKIPETKSINFTEICFLIFSTKFWDE